MDVARIDEIDELVRSAASFSLYAANPKHHLARLVSVLPIGARARLVRELHNLARASRENEHDTATFVARRILDGEWSHPSDLGSHELRFVLGIVNGSDVTGVATLLATSILNDAESVVSAVELSLEKVIRGDVTLPEQGACILAACDYSATQVAKLECIPDELSHEFGLLGIERAQSEDHDIDSSDDEEPVVEEEDPLDLSWWHELYTEDNLKERLSDAARADPFLRGMLPELELLSSHGEMALVVPQNIDTLRTFAGTYASTVRRILKTQETVLPVESMVSRLGLQERPTGLVVPLRQLVAVRDKLANMVRAAHANRDALLALSPAEFERFIVGVFRNLGFEVEHTALTRDGGADLLCLRSDHGIPLRLAVEVKRYKPDRLIDVSMVRSFVGANEKFGANRMVFVTTSGYTKPAWEFGEKYAQKLLVLKDYEAIREWCHDVRQRQGW